MSDLFSYTSVGKSINSNLFFFLGFHTMFFKHVNDCMAVLKQCKNVISLKIDVKIKNK